MLLPFLNYNPFDCTCPLASWAEYCAYCDIVCDLALADYEADIGNLVAFGQSELEVNQAVERQTARNLSLAGVYPYVPLRLGLTNPLSSEEEMIAMPEEVVPLPLHAARSSLVHYAQVHKCPKPYIRPALTKRRW
ncbi:hypothetical protein RhiJN_26529 [Ceratobasidium sp. AG-Ba]|nr:hypothetical protein RhiJN_12476 [Ceratobasidium sp. AG-Ba]QRV98510.1 hypothetical protein RhiJN_26529 [Ceratobasidium sp. AG-Ba]